MICPVCEHSQASGTTCDVCGKALADVQAAPAVVVPIEGLEATLLAGPAEVAAASMEGLELTNFAPTAGPPPVAMPEFDLRPPQVGAVAVQQMAELSEDRIADDGVRTEPPVGEVTCPNCQQRQEDGLICNTCGMRLPKLALVGVLLDAAPSLPEGTVIRCDWCGARGKAGLRCGECGHILPTTASS